MTRLLTAATVLFLTSGGTFVVAQTSSAGKPSSGAATSPGTKDAPPPTKAQGLNPDATNYGNGMMGPGMMGPMGMMGMCPGAAGASGAGAGMMGPMGMMGACPGMSGPATKVKVTKQAKGSSMIITAEDPQVVARLQGAADNWGGCMMGGQGHMMGGQGHMMGPGMMGQGGQGCCGGGTGAGACSGMMGPGTNVQVAKVAKGVSFTMTGTDAKAVSRIQKMTEAMRLMHEAWQQ